ncbi:MAG: energy-coupling factor ABC transporter ATP-binding protein [Lactovum sp.]
MTKIKFKDINFSYQELEIFKDFSLILNGQSTAIIGENGVGKTTLMKLLNGLLTVDSGDIFLDDFLITDMELTQRASKIAYVFQNPNDQIFKSRVLDELMFGPLNLGKTRQEAEQAAKEAISEFNLEDRLEENPYDLSLAERKQIAIASILAMDTQVVILDEPTIGQDMKGKKQLKALIKKLTEAGKLVIAILHDMDFVLETFDQIVILKEGKILAQGDKLSVFSQEEILKEASLEMPVIPALSKYLKHLKLALSLEEFLDNQKQA